MFKIRLTAMCPECDEEMVNFMGDAVGNPEPTVDICSFEQTTFHCDKCNKDYFTGDIDLWGEDEI